MRWWQEKGYTVSRTAGSHGFADLYAVKSGVPVECIQCKKMLVKSAALHKLQQFRRDPPMLPDRYFHQVLMVKFRGGWEMVTV